MVSLPIGRAPPVRMDIQRPANTLSPLPVSRKDFMLESTRGQPQETPRNIFDPAFNLSCVTSRHAISSIASISNVTRDTSVSLSGSAQLNTSRLGGLHSSTLPAIQTSFSGLRCCHSEPFFQSETFANPPQYWQVNSGLVIASHNFFGVRSEERRVGK